MELTRKQEGFDGEIRIVMPPSVLKENKQVYRHTGLFITDIGYYPKAKHHSCSRPKGSPEHILIHCVDGYGIIWIKGEKFILGANQYILIESSLAHYYEADPNNPWTIFWLHFSGQNSKSIVIDIQKRIKSKRNSLPFEGTLFTSFHQICNLLSQGYSREILEYISLTLPQYFANYLYPDIHHQRADSEKEIIDKSIEFLKGQLGNRIELTKIADHVHLSVSHFSKLFKSRTGYSPIAYLNHLKIQKACFLLQFSTKRISIISYDLGFEDQYYFSRLFKEHMGVSPQHYRNNLK